MIEEEPFAVMFALGVFLGLWDDDRIPRPIQVLRSVKLNTIHFVIVEILVVSNAALCLIHSIDWFKCKEAEKSLLVP